MGDVLSSGAISNKFQVHLSLTQETASVDEVQNMLKEQLGFDVILLNSKHLPVMSGETTKGKPSSYNSKSFSRVKKAFYFIL